MRFYAIPAIVGFIIGTMLIGLPSLDDIKSNKNNDEIEKSSQNAVLLGIEDRINKKREVIGFLPFWLIDQADKNYEKYLTEISYFGVSVGEDGKIVEKLNRSELEPGLTWLRKDSFREELKTAKEKDVKLSLLMHNMNEASIQEMLKNPEITSQTFMEEVTPIMKEGGFTDLSIDIESIVRQTDETRQRFVTLIKNIKQKIDEDALGTLTINVVANSLIEKHLTDTKGLEPYIDRFVIMAYDYHYVDSAMAGPVAPINGNTIKREYDVETAIQKMLESVPKEKIILGIPLYGYAWDTVSNIPGAPAIKATGKVLTHKQIKKVIDDCEKENKKCKKGVDEDYKQPYLIVSSSDGVGEYYQQIFYEDIDSIREKLILVEKYDIRGVALWAIGYEGEEIRELFEQYVSESNSR